MRVRGRREPGLYGKVNWKIDGPYWDGVIAVSWKKAALEDARR